MSVRAIVAGVVLASLSACPARAVDRGMNIAWDACGPTGGSSKSFDCATNEGQAVLQVSFMLSDLDAWYGPFNAYQGTVTIFAPREIRRLPDWWQFGSSGCREGMLACTFAPDAGTACAPMPGFPDTSWTLFYYQDTGDMSVFPLGLIRVGEDPVPVELAAGVEYFLLRLTIKYAKSAGADSCSGCSEPIVIGVEGIDLESDTGSIHIETPLRQQYVYWTGSTVPVRRTSWGLIKGLYR